MSQLSDFMKMASASGLSSSTLAKITEPMRYSTRQEKDRIASELMVIIEESKTEREVLQRAALVK